MVVVDIWTGHLHEDYVARYVAKSIKDKGLVRIIQDEVDKGNLVNILIPDSENCTSFDDRMHGNA